MPTIYFRFAACGSGAPQRAPLLERVLAGAAPPVPVENWRAEAFRALNPQSTGDPPVAAIALRAAVSAGTVAGVGTAPGVHTHRCVAPAVAATAGAAPAVAATTGAAPEIVATAGVAAGEWVCIATPVHLIAGMTSVSLPENGILALDPAEAATLAHDFNRDFGGAGTRLVVGRGALLLAVFDRCLQVDTRDPEEVLGRDIWGFLPKGNDAPHLRRLMSELEMWLFEHAANRARGLRALPLVSGLWLWGGGATLASLPTVHGWAAGTDPLFAAFDVRENFPSDPGSGVVVSAAEPGTAVWPEVEHRWLEPALRALKSGRIRQLELSAGDRRCSVGAAWRRRFWRRRLWRRARPWWECFDRHEPNETGANDRQ